MVCVYFGCVYDVCLNMMSLCIVCVLFMYVVHSHLSVLSRYEGVVSVFVWYDVLCFVCLVTCCCLYVWVYGVRGVFVSYVCIVCVFVCCVCLCAIVCLPIVMVVHLCVYYVLLCMCVY